MLAAQAGLRAMHDGGSAADMVIAMAAVMTVVQPQYSHLGGDAFAVVYRAGDRSVHALNSSGPTPRGLDVEPIRRRGTVPVNGAEAVTVPGCVGGWWALHQADGRLPWKSLFEGAIGLGRDGFPASRGLARAVGYWPVRRLQSEYFDATFGHVGGDGGQTVRQPVLAATLEAIADGGADAFYGGDVAKACLEALQADGGAHEEQDWRDPSRWVEPIKAGFRGTTVYTQPPQSRGLVLALALQAYERALSDGTADTLAAQFRALEDAFEAINANAGDPDVTGFDAQAFLRNGGTPGTAAATAVADGDTTYMLAIDGDGNAVSFIQSVFAAWGSGLWAPKAGVLFNNRALGFTLERGHPNEMAPGKRPMHTLHCYLATDAKDRSLRVVGGTPGAHRQPTTNLQMLDAVVRRGMDAQDALDLPRWALGLPQGYRGAVELEMRPGDGTAAAFERAGISVQPVEGWHGMMGRAFVATVGDDGMAAGTDLRGEGVALAF